MKCRSELEAERERLVKELAALRERMMGPRPGPETKFPYNQFPIPRNNTTDTLDEASIQGQIKAIDYMLAPPTGDWPHDCWFLFIEVRTDAIRSLVKAGKSVAEIIDTLNLTEIQTRLIIQMDVDPAKN